MLVYRPSTSKPISVSAAESNLFASSIVSLLSPNNKYGDGDSTRSYLFTQNPYVFLDTLLVVKNRGTCNKGICSSSNYFIDRVDINTAVHL